MVVCCPCRTVLALRSRLKPQFLDIAPLATRPCQLQHEVSGFVWCHVCSREEQGTWACQDGRCCYLFASRYSLQRPCNAAAMPLQFRGTWTQWKRMSIVIIVKVPKRTNPIKSQSNDTWCKLTQFDQGVPVHHQRRWSGGQVRPWFEERQWCCESGWRSRRGQQLNFSRITAITVVHCTSWDLTWFDVSSSDIENLNFHFDIVE